MRKVSSVVLCVGLVLFLGATVASATPSLVYQGTFKLPSSSAWGDYYYSYATFVPNGNVRPGNIVPVTGPSLVVYTNWAGNVREINGFPTLAKLPSDPLLTATLVTNANGGTGYAGRPVSIVDSAGNLWDPETANNWGPKFYSNVGTHLLGEGVQPALSVVEAGWPDGNHLSHGNGVLRKGDGLGGNLPLNGTTVGAKFLTSSRYNVNLGQGAQDYTAVMESTRLSATAMNSTTLFYTTHTGHRPMEYVRDTGGAEWFLLWLPGTHTGDSYKLDFYASNSTGLVTPTMQLDVGPAIAAGAGWLEAGSNVNYVAVDWNTSTLYVMDAGVYGNTNNRTARMHVFTLFEPPPAPVAEPGVLGLTLLGLPLVLRRKGRSLVMRKVASVVPCAVLALLLVAGTASAAPTLAYEGSFKLPNSSAWGDYYYNTLTFVPAGNARPGWTGAPVPGPSLIASNVWGSHVNEFNQLPAPSKTAGGMGTAVRLLNANGGTAYVGYYPTSVDSAGNLWDSGQAYDQGPGVISNPLPSGTHLLGGSAGASLPPKETGWYNGPGGTNYGADGTLRLGNGSGGAYPTDGTAIGAHFLAGGNLSADPSPSTLYISDNVRTSATTVSGSLLFTIVAANYGAGKIPIQYVKDTMGAEFFMMWSPGPHTGDTFLLNFYLPSTTGSNVSPSFSLDIGPGIATGAGWLTSTSRVGYVAVDWNSSRLYVLDAGTDQGLGRDARVHVFTLFEPPPPPVAEPAVLGLSLLGLPLVLRRRSA